MQNFWELNKPGRHGQGQVSANLGVVHACMQTGRQELRSLELVQAGVNSLIHSCRHPGRPCVFPVFHCVSAALPWKFSLSTTRQQSAEKLGGKFRGSSSARRPARPHSTPLRDAALRPQFSLPAQSPVRVRTSVHRPPARPPPVEKS